MRYATLFLTALWLLCSSFLTATVYAASVPKGTRTLGLSVGPAEDSDYPHALAAAQSAGVQSVTLSLDWSRLETAPGHYDNTLLTIADGFYPPRHIQVDLILRPINTNHSEVPTDIKGRSFDDSVIIARFERLLDDVFAQTSHLTLHSLVIGNEVDAFLSDDPARWAQYKTFYQTICDYAHTKHPNLKIGVAATFSGLTGETQKSLLMLNKASDLIVATYYPLNSDFTVRAPSAPSLDLARLCGLYPGRSIMLSEAGYPSNPDCGSSPLKQSDFIRSLFAAWDAHASQIVSITLSWQTDIAPAAMSSNLRYYGVSSNKFAGFLGSLGLRTYAGAGQDKPAFAVLKAEAHSRGW